jgi:tRNA 2-thiocytidine biosynthesis protein TtcA
VAGDAVATPASCKLKGHELRHPLEARIAKKTTRAILDYRMIEDGDRVMVGLSGGKDSWALLQILSVLRERAPIDFSLVAVNVDSGYEGYQHELVAEACRTRGWEFHRISTSIGETIDTVLDADQTPCSLCARLRRGVLYRVAARSEPPRLRWAITPTTSSRRCC